MEAKRDDGGVGYSLFGRVHAVTTAGHLDSPTTMDLPNDARVFVVVIEKESGCDVPWSFAWQDRLRITLSAAPTKAEGEAK